MAPQKEEPRCEELGFLCAGPRSPGLLTTRPHHGGRLSKAAGCSPLGTPSLMLNSGVQLPGDDCSGCCSSSGWWGGTASPPRLPSCTHETFGVPGGGGRGSCFHATSPARVKGPWVGCLRWGIPEVPVLLNLPHETSSSTADMRTAGQRPPSQRWRAPAQASACLYPPPCPLSIPPRSGSGGRACTPTLPSTLCRRQVMGKDTPNGGSAPPPSTQACVPPLTKAQEAAASPHQHSTPSPRQLGIVLGRRGEEEPGTPLPSREQSPPRGC